MGLKKRSKVSAEFSMSSLTDIIFLLLIFFMLTSKMVRIQPFELPKSDSKTVAATDMVVAIKNTGEFTFNEKELPFSGLEGELRTKLGALANKDNATVTIVAEVGTSFDEVVKVMTLAGKLRMKAIIATQPQT